jgi:glycosyltransferase involved in cell wall biosynthesis
VAFVEADSVSVVIPAFNAACFIDQTIESVLSQTRQPEEIIVVDDGSTDDTAARLASYGRRIIIIRQQNQGVAAACNNGARAATGKWLAFLDSDDMWMEDKLAHQLAACRDYVMSYTDCVYFGNVNKEIRRSSFENLVGGDILRHLVVRNLIPKSSVLVLKSTYMEHGGFPEDYASVEDWPLWVAISARHPIGYCPEPLLRYRVHQQSKTMQVRQTLKDHIRLIDTITAADGIASTCAELRSTALASSYSIHSHYAAQSGDWRFALYCGLNAVRHQPGDLALWKNAIKAGMLGLGVPY